MKTYTIEELTGYAYNCAIENTFDESIKLFGVRELTNQERFLGEFSAFAFAKHLGIKYNDNGDIIRG